jgi:hypothetical protein
MATVKTAYTVEQAAELVAAYTANPSAEVVATFAEKFGKSVKSVVAKLSREGVYQKKEYVSKTGVKPVKKDELATQFQTKFGLTEAEADSLTKANKTALAKILNSFKTLEATASKLLDESKSE